MSRKLTTREFIEKSKKLHFDKYDYSRAVYTKSTDKIIIICKKHGEFKQMASKHMNAGDGCSKCSRKYRYTTKEFIEESKKLHGNKYNYSITKYVGARSKISFICPTHGKFTQLATNHLHGWGCSKCGKDVLSQLYTKTTKEFITLANKKHNHKYDYSTVNYTGSHEKVIILCNEHGVFEQNASSHLCGNGCPQCSVPGYDITKIGILYVLKYTKLNEDHAFIKIGITHDLKQRLVNLRKSIRTTHNIKTLHTVSGDGLEIKNLESNLLNYFKRCQYTELLKSSVDGKTEFLKIETLNEILDKLNNI